MALAALTIGLAACSQEDYFTPSNSDIVQIASTHIATEVQTRVNTEGDGTSFEKDDVILLVNNSRNNKNEGTYLYSGETWSPEAGMVLWATNTAEANEFTAYYPADKEFTLPTDQHELKGLKSADHMIGTASAKKENAVNLSFAHQNAKVTIITTLQASYGSDATITDLKIGDIQPYNVSNTYTAILTPGGKVTITLKVNGESLKASSETVLEAGKHYTLKLWIGKAEATVSVENITDWKAEKLAIEDKTATEISGNIDATNMTADELKARVALALKYGKTNIAITMPSTPDKTMFTAVRRALIDTEGVADGSIDLTLAGVTSIPDHSEVASDGSVIFGEVIALDKENYLESPEYVLELKSVNLPHATYIGKMAFCMCEKLESITAPKAQILGDFALSFTKLTAIEFPELTTICGNVFSGTATLTSAKFPNVTKINDAGLLIGGRINTDFQLELTAEDDISIGRNAFNMSQISYSKNINLVLNANKKNQVTDGTTWNGYTFKTITFAE